ncbi:MAG: hypothetical protein ACI936_003942 [Paraglaciecola sp.]|jgi:hypothetical protein
MRFFDGFDKKDLIIGTSGLYAATLALIFMSMLLNQYSPLRKSSEFHKRNNLKASDYVTVLQLKKTSGYKTSLRFGSRVMLDDKTSLSMVAYHVDLIMQGSEFDSIYFVLNCSKVDCGVVFLAKEEDKRGLTNLANERFVSIWK